MHRWRCATPLFPFSDARPLPKKRGTLRIGTCGFNFPDWRGTFYPEKLDPAEWLGHYAGRFDTLELRLPFFRMPNDAILEHWRNASPPGFVFSTRANKVITHNKMLRGCGRELSQFRTGMARLGAKLGAILWQLPSGFQQDLRRLDVFLKVVTQTWRARHAVQFRHSTWLEPRTYSLLKRHNVSVVNSDALRGVVNGVVTADFVYVRKHGPKGSGRKSYGERALREEADRVKAWLDQGLDVLVYFDNNTSGFAAKNALRLKELCNG